MSRNQNQKIKLFWTKDKVLQFAHLFIEASLPSRDVEFEKEEEWFKRLKKRKLFYLSKIQILLKNVPDDFELRILESYFLGILGEGKDAVKKAGEALKSPQSETASPRIKAIAWLVVANSLNLHNFTEGTIGYLELYRRAIEADPSNVDAAICLAETATDAGDEGYQEALTVLDKAIELNTKTRKLFRLYKECAYLAAVFADYERAIYFYELIEKIKPFTEMNIKRYLGALTYVTWVAEDDRDESNKILNWLEKYKELENYEADEVRYEIYFDELIKEVIQDHKIQRTPKTMAKLAMCFELYPFTGAKDISDILEKAIDDLYSEANPNFYNQLCEEVVPEINQRLNEIADGKVVFKLKNPFPPVMTKTELGTWKYPKGKQFGDIGEIESDFIEVD